MSTITTINSGDSITNSRADINQNFANLNSDKIETSVLDTDTTLANNSDSKIATQKAVKAYVDAGGNVNASTTAKGIVELSSQTEVNEGSATGGSGAALAVTPDTLKAITGPTVRTYLAAASPATWTKPTGIKYVVVEVQAAGGNGANGADNGGDGLPGAGGGGGGYSRELIAAASLGATETVTIGAVGNSSSFGSHCSATGGSNASGAVPGDPGVGSGGDINCNGQGGSPSDIEAGTYNQGGLGGAAVLGGGGKGGTTGVNGGAGGNYGGGGGGGYGSGSSATNGGAGGPAIVIVTEHYV